MISESAGFPGVPDQSNILGRDPRPVVGCDQEVWVRNQIITAMRMALAITQQREVGADDTAMQHGFYGVAEGAAIEIIHTLCMEPSYINLRKIPRK